MDPATTRAMRAASTKEAVLAAAKTCFGTLGYERATIRGIARAAGASTGAVFGHFPDKAAIYRAVYGHPPVSPEIGAGLVNVVRRAVNGSPFDREMACGLLAKLVGV